MVWDSYGTGDWEHYKTKAASRDGILESFSQTQVSAIKISAFLAFNYYGFLRVSEKPISNSRNVPKLA